MKVQQMEILKQVAEYLEKGDREKVCELTGQAIEQNVSARQILDDGLIAGMKVVGDRFRKYEIFLPEVLIAARAMNAGMDLIKPLFIKEGITSTGKIVIGTVYGDLHDLGKNLAGVMLKGAGFEVIDLGNNVSAQKFVDVAVKENATVIGMSALLTTTMTEMNNVTNLLKEKGLDRSIKTIIGGAPISEEYAKSIGADAYAYDAASGVELVKQLV
jgi:5-methyltetrahydrofolate--homocysteine methyltransferase